MYDCLTSITVYRDFDPADLQFDKRVDDYNGLAAYTSSKTAMLLWMIHLHETEKANGIDTILYFPSI